MRYDDGDRESRNVEDRRGQGSGMFGPRAGGMQIPIGRGGLGLTGLLIIAAISLLFGINPLDLLGSDGSIRFPDIAQLPRSDQAQPGPVGRRGTFDLPAAGTPGSPSRASQDDMKRFVSRVLADMEDFWGKEFQRHGLRYEDPKLVLFTGATQTACGAGSAAMGPFYCPQDRKIYIDLKFYEDLKTRFKAPGDFAQAYVVAHEVGHHIQVLLGISDNVWRLKSGLDQRQGNEVQVRMELQAECLAGMWAKRIDDAKSRLQPGDIEEGLNAASAIGDDTLQRQTQGRVVPDAFTHGSSAQRVRWFKRGFDKAQLQACDTFSVTKSEL